MAEKFKPFMRVYHGQHWSPEADVDACGALVQRHECRVERRAAMAQNTDGADDYDIEDMSPGCVGYRLDPGGGRMSERRQIAARALRQPRCIALSGWARLQREMRGVVSCVFHVPTVLPASCVIRDSRRIYASRLPGRHESFRRCSVLPPDRRRYELASIAARTRSGVNGISVSRAPTASWIALAIRT